MEKVYVIFKSERDWDGNWEVVAESFTTTKEEAEEYINSKRGWHMSIHYHYSEVSKIISKEEPEMILDTQTFAHDVHDLMDEYQRFFNGSVEKYYHPKNLKGIMKEFYDELQKLKSKNSYPKVSF